ncbi:MAG: CHAT domain-containing tetratricopeptide repeat protein [Planctomycetaceae bacterium]|nr:CHAT domain-containing tetratricopeptide repeat protein [Planctomycetaceae bacterium]
MKNLILCLLASLLIPATMADDVAIVTAENGYLLDADGNVKRVVSTYETLTATARIGDLIAVETGGQSLRIHKGQVHLLGEQWQAVAHPMLLSIIDGLQRANTMEPDQARDALEQLLKRTESGFGDDAPMYLVLQSVYAANLLEAGEIDQANELMRTARKRVQQLDLAQTLVAAEVFNVSGLVDYERGKLPAAQKKFTAAMAVAASILGDDHQDMAVYRYNRSLAMDETTQYQAAINDLQTATGIYQKVLPAAAIEQPRSLISQAELHLAAEQPLPAITTVTSALGMLRTWHIDQKVDLAICQFYLGEAWQQRDQFREAERWYNAINTTLPAGSAAGDVAYMLSMKKETLHALGDMDYARENYQAALDHYSAAAQLSDNDNLLTIDGWSYTYAADALTELGRTQSAQKLYKGAWLIFEKTDGEDSELALDARKLFEEAGGQIAANSQPATDVAMNEAPLDTPGPDASATSGSSADASGTAFMKMGEGMLVTTVNAAIMDESTVLARVAAGTQLWRLETKGDWYRVMVPGEDRSAWVSKNSVRLEREQHAREISELIIARTGDSQAVARINSRMMELIRQRGEVLKKDGPVATIPIQLEMVSLFADAVGDDHSMTVTARSQLAASYLAAKQFLKARKLIEESLPSFRRVLGKEHPSVAFQLMTLSGLLGMIGDSPGAERALQEATEIAMKRFGSTDIRTLKLKVQLAVALANNGALEQAAELYEQVRDLTADHPSLHLTSTVGRASVTLMQRKLKEGIAQMEQAQALCRTMGDAADVTRAFVEDALAIGHFALGDKKQSLLHSRAAMEFYQKSGTADSVSQPARARLATLGSDWDELLRICDQIREQAVDTFGEQSVRVAGAWNGRGSALASMGRYDDAVIAFEQGRRISQHHAVNVLVDLSVSQQIAYLKSLDSAALYSALSLGVVALDNDAVAAASAGWLLNSKNVANELAARDIQARRLCTADSHIADYDRWLDSRRRLATLPPLSNAEAEDAHIRETEQRLQQAADRSFARLPDELQTFLNSRKTSWVTCDEIRSRLTGDEVFVDIARLRESRYDAPSSRSSVRPFIYAAWIIPGNSEEPVRVVKLGDADTLDRELITPYLDQVMSSAAKIKTVGEDGALVEMAELSRGLTQRIWLPLAKHLPKGTKRLTLCPDAALWSIPWAAIEQPNRKLVLEDYVVRFVSSGRDLLREQAEVADLQPPTIIADPDYGVAAADIPQENSGETLRAVRLLKNVDATLLKEMLPSPVQRLDGTGKEAVAIAPFLNEYSGMKPDMFLRKAASETALRLTRRPHTLFVGTHGFFLKEEELPDEPLSLGNPTALPDSPESNQRLNPLRRCGLLLAGCSTLPSGSDSDNLDGILTGSEIVGLDLQGTKLVVMSACETGVGDLTSGQGVAGLRQAVQLAGAESVVSTLWKIPDSETKRLMTAYFEHLAAGESRASALRLAQLDRIRARRDRNGAAHPFFWAAFTVTGQD